MQINKLSIYLNYLKKVIYKNNIYFLILKISYLYTYITSNLLIYILILSFYT